MLTYQDYVNYLASRDGGESGGGGMLSGDQFNALGLRDRFSMVGGGLGIAPEDPRYEQLAGATRPEAGRDIGVIYGAPPESVSGVRFLNDPSRVAKGDGWSAYSDDNVSAEMRDYNDMGVMGGDDKFDWVKGALFMLGAGAAGGAFAGGAAGLAPATEGMLAAGAGEGFGGASMFTGGSAGAGAAGAGAAGSGFDFSPMEPISSGNVGNYGPSFELGAESAGAAGSSGGAFGSTPTGVMAPGMENAALADSWLINNGMSGMAGGNVTGLLGTGGLGNAGSSIAQWAMKNPMQAYGLVQTVGGMFGGGSSGGNGGGSSSKSSNGSGVGNIQRPQFQQNPYLAAQLQRGGYQ